MLFVRLKRIEYGLGATGRRAIAANVAAFKKIAIETRRRQRLAIGFGILL
jgi:hypothetical protein